MRPLLVAAVLAAPLPAAASDLELSFYLGVQDAPHSGVSGTAPGLGTVDFNADWEGRSFENPPYYGLRAIWWQPSGWGFGVELNHAKVYATDETLATSGLSRLELSDGLNLVTLNAMKRFKPWGKIVPYAGLGVGAAIPHVEVSTPTSTTFEYQVTGPAVIWVAGGSYDLSDRWAIFGEYKGSYSMNTFELEGGGELESNIVTNALNFGVTYKF
jgi:lipid A oxidase